MKTGRCLLAISKKKNITPIIDYNEDTEETYTDAIQWEDKTRSIERITTKATKV